MEQRVEQKKNEKDMKEEMEEEHGAQLSQPFGFHSRHTSHVFFGCHD